MAFDGCNTLGIKMDQMAACIGARETINVTCFRRAYEGHKKALQDTVNALLNCQGYWAAMGCGLR